MNEQEQRRAFLRLLGTSAGSMLLSACGGGSSTSTATTGGSSDSTAPPPASTPASTSTSTSTSPSAPASTPAPPAFAALKTYLQNNAVAGLALPATAISVPTIDWAGPLVGSGTPASSLPDGVVYPLTDSRLSVPIFNQYSAALPGNPMVGGYPCLIASRPYICKGVAKRVGSVQTLRLKTDAPVVEFSGVIVDGNGCPMTLIVDGSLVPAKILSSSLGQGGGYDLGTIRVDFGTRQTRDIWIESFMYITYVKLDQDDTLTALNDSSDPQITAVGDSYLGVRSANFGNNAAIALSLGARLGIRRIASDTIGGTGYWNSGGDLGNLNDRLPGHAVDDSSIYLVMAGLNDYADSTGGQLAWPSNATWEAAVQNYLQGLRSAQPGALIVVCTPFCPNPTLSDSSYVVNPTTNPTGVGDYLYKAALFKKWTQSLSPPWIYIDVLMGTGWLNSSGATGDATALQWFTGGTPAAGTTATNKPGNTQGGGGGGFGGIATVPVATAGQYSQAPDVYATGGSGSGLMLWSNIDSSGNLTAVNVQVAGAGYTSTGLPTITIDPTYQLQGTAATVLGQATLITGVNPTGQYPLQSWEPAGITATQLNNIYTYLQDDLTHPSPPGAEYLAQRLAQNIYDAVMAL